MASRPFGRALLGACLLLLAACRPETADPTLQPDSVLQAALGLTPRDRVYRIHVSGGDVERADPAGLSIEAGSYVEFVTTDWLVHEILFDTTSLSADQKAFLRNTDQVHSPPLIDRGSRYVLSFVDAPPGRYTFRLEGNSRASTGAIVVAGPDEAHASAR